MKNERWSKLPVSVEPLCRGSVPHATLTRGEVLVALRGIGFPGSRRWPKRRDYATIGELVVRQAQWNLNDGRAERYGVSKDEELV